MINLQPPIGSYPLVPVNQSVDLGSDLNNHLSYSQDRLNLSQTDVSLHHRLFDSLSVRLDKKLTGILHDTSYVQASPTFLEVVRWAKGLGDAIQIDSVDEDIVAYDRSSCCLVIGSNVCFDAPQQIIKLFHALCIAQQKTKLQNIQFDLDEDGMPPPMSVWVRQQIHNIEVPALAKKVEMMSQLKQFQILFDDKASYKGAKRGNSCGMSLGWHLFFDKDDQGFFRISQGGMGKLKSLAYADYDDLLPDGICDFYEELYWQGYQSWFDEQDFESIKPFIEKLVKRREEINYEISRCPENIFSLFFNLPVSMQKRIQALVFTKSGKPIRILLDQKKKEQQKKESKFELFYLRGDIKQISENSSTSIGVSYHVVLVFFDNKGRPYVIDIDCKKPSLLPLQEYISLVFQDQLDETQQIKAKSFDLVEFYQKVFKQNMNFKEETHVTFWDIFWKCMDSKEIRKEAFDNGMSLQDLMSLSVHFENA